MKTRMKKVSLITSVTLMLLCLILITGSTFSLFTSKAGNDIAVNSAVVGVEAEITELALSSLGEAQNGDTFANGGSAKYENKVLAVKDMTPGDKIDFNVIITNGSNVDIRYRVVWSIEGELSDVLATTVDGEAFENGTSEWTLWTADSGKEKTIKVSVELPIEVDDEYQDKSADIHFVVEAIQGNGVGHITDEFDTTQYVTTPTGLREAFKNGGKVVLSGDVESDGESFEIPAGVTVDLDLNGKNISDGDGNAIVNNGTLNITDSAAVTVFALRRSAAIGGSIISGSTYAINNSGTLEIESIVCGGVFNSGALTIDGGTFVNTVSGKHTVYHNGSSLVINGGSFENHSANATVYAAAANAVINNGTFTQVTKSYLLDGNGGITVNGGMFYGYVNDDGTVDTIRGEITVSKGSFNFDSTNWLSDGLTVGDNGDGTYTVLPESEEGVKYYYDVKSGLYYDGKATWGTYYVFDKADLFKASAYFAGQEFTTEANICTIELVADIDLTDEIWTPWSVMWITFNGNGHKISNVTTEASWRAGFFGYLGASKVNDLTLENVVSNGAQAGTFIGSAEGVTTTNCTLAGTNVVNYVEYVSETYTETWGGIGAVTGVVTQSTINATIAEGATVEVNNGILITNCAYIDDLTGYLQANSGAVTNNGTVTVTGNHYVFVAAGLGKDEGNDYYVADANGFAALNEMMCNKTAGKNITVSLLDDIYFAGKTWTPVDSHADTAFSFNTLNGNGHTIYDLTVNGQAMFTRFAGFGDVTITDVTFERANVNSNGTINTAIIVGHTYQNVLLDNVDVKDSAVIGGYKVATLIGTVYNEGSSTITATLKNCDVVDTIVTATKFDFCTTGMVAFVRASDNDKIEFENCTVSGVKIFAPDDIYKAHAWVYTTGSESLYNEADGVTVTDCTFEGEQ